jgi:threonine dehydratase
VTHSSGNHGGALALAAKLRGITAHVVVPHDTPLCKIKAIEGYGGAACHAIGRPCLVFSEMTRRCFLNGADLPLLHVL